MSVFGVVLELEKQSLGRILDDITDSELEYNRKVMVAEC